MEDELRFGVLGWWEAQDGEVGVWVEAVDEAGARRSLDAEAAGADGNATVGRDLDGGTLAEDGRPPRAGGGGRSVVRPSIWASRQAASGVMASSRWRS